jgi:uncharacterized protein (UPF0276 family)
MRTPHQGEALAAHPTVGFMEVHAENYMGGGASLAFLHRIREHWPIGVHAVGTSLGSANGLDPRHVQRLRRLIERIEPFVVSEHLSWSVSPDGAYLNDLLPLPYTEEALSIVVANVGHLQEALNRRILIENPSTYLRFQHSPIPEPEFLAELSRRAGCGVLLDVNNIHVSLTNHGGNPLAYMDAVPADAVGEIHLAGHAVNDADGIPILIDDHGSAVADVVWSLYAEAVRRFPTAPTLVEWDSNLPSLERLVAEAVTADAHRRAALAEKARAHAA